MSMTGPEFRKLMKMLKGGISFSEAALLRELAAKVKKGCIVEIGSFRGKSAIALAAGVSDQVNSKGRSPIYCIEPHRPFVGYYGGKLGPQDREAFYTVMCQTGGFNLVSLINLSSEEVAPSWKQPISLMFIDGDHRYEGVRADFEYWDPYVVPGGKIAFHDSTDLEVGPYRLIQEILAGGGYRKIDEVDKITVLQKTYNPNAYYSVTPPQMNILIPCESMVMAGGLVRFERIGKVLSAWGHKIAFATMSKNNVNQFHSSFPVLTLEQALDRRWGCVMAPGAGFADSVIKEFSVFRQDNFGVRVQHILNDQSRRPKFKKLNEYFSPNVVIFNNTHWPIGSFTDFQADRFHFLPGAVDLKQFRPPTYRIHPDSGQSWVIGGLANKNPEPLITALELQPSTTTIRLFGRNSELLSERHQDLIAEGRLELVGLLTGRELSAFYHSVDCVVTTENTAGWTNLAAEAMASGTPVICTPHGTRAFATHNVTALVIDEPGSDLIAENVKSLMNDPSLCQRLAESGRRFLEDNDDLSWESYGNQLLKLAHHDGKQHYYHAPELGLFGKWPVQSRLNGLEPLLDKTQGLSVIDFGAAEGVISREFLKRGAAKVHGFELNPSRVATAESLCGEWNEAAFRSADLSDWKKFSLENADFLQEVYDVVLYLGLQHHLPVSRRIEFLNSALAMAGRYFAIRTTETVYSADNIDDLVESSGFRLVSQETDREGDHIGSCKIFEKVVQTKKPVPIIRNFVSFPKSGRTWIRFVLYQLNLDKSIVFHHDTFEFNDGNRPPLDFDISRRIEKYKNIDHLVYLERDPRDLMVSFYYQITGRFKDFFNYDKDISSFIRDDYFGAQNLRQFREMWNEIVRELGFLKITYEECHRDMALVIRKLLDYYDFDIPSELLGQAIENARFNNMKKLEQSQSFPRPWLRPRNQSPKVRQGRIGGHLSELDSEDSNYLNQVFGFTDK